MTIRFHFRALILGGLAVAALPLLGCGGRDMDPKGPEMGELEKYMSEHPELMVENDEEIDSENEFENAQ